jgi:hypothetical protein
VSVALDDEGDAHGRSAALPGAPVPCGLELRHALLEARDLGALAVTVTFQLGDEVREDRRQEPHHGAAGGRDGAALDPPPRAGCGLREPERRQRRRAGGVAQPREELVGVGLRPGGQ